MKYLVSHQSQQSGPFTLDEVVAQIRRKELDLFDYIYDLEKDDWVLMMEFAPLAAKLKDNKPGKPQGPPVPTKPTGAPKLTLAPTVEAEVASAPAVTAAAPAPAVEASAHAITEWFVLKGENRFGPFAYTDLIKMLQQKVVFPFDFVWNTGLDGWKRVAEIADFQTTSIRKLLVEVASPDVFVQRRFTRRPHTGRVMIHDGHSLWRGQGIEISKGGVGVTMQNTKVVPGQQLTLHFSQQGEFPAFNAICEVVSKKFVSDNTPVEYGLRFLSMSQETQDELYKKVA